MVYNGNSYIKMYDDWERFDVWCPFGRFDGNHLKSSTELWKIQLKRRGKIGIFYGFQRHRWIDIWGKVGEEYFKGFISLVTNGLMAKPMVTNGTDDFVSKRSRLWPTCWNGTYLPFQNQCTWPESKENTTASLPSATPTELKPALCKPFLIDHWNTPFKCYHPMVSSA